MYCYVLGKKDGQIRISVENIYLNHIITFSFKTYSETMLNSVIIC